VNVLLLFVTSLQIPFKFFLEKEFLFIIYDEIVNESVSQKIQDQRKALISEQQKYTHLSMKRLSDQHYQLVREPYLRLSSKEYRILTTSVYLANVLLLFLIKTPFLRRTQRP